MISDHKFNVLAQKSHVLGGCLWILGTDYLFGHTVMAWGSIVAVLLAAWKEFYWDERFEGPDERGSSLEDFCFYVVGLVVGVSIVLIKGAVS